LVEDPLPVYRGDSTNIQAHREILNTLQEMGILLDKVEDRLTALEKKKEVELHEPTCELPPYK